MTNGTPRKRQTAGTTPSRRSTSRSVVRTSQPADDLVGSPASAIAPLEGPPKSTTDTVMSVYGRGPIAWLLRKRYQFELTTALYMLEPWEKALFSTIVKRAKFIFVDGFVLVVCLLTIVQFPTILESLQHSFETAIYITNLFMSVVRR